MLCCDDHACNEGTIEDIVGVSPSNLHVVYHHNSYTLNSKGMFDMGMDELLGSLPDMEDISIDDLNNLFDNTFGADITGDNIKGGDVTVGDITDGDITSGKFKSSRESIFSVSPRSTNDVSAIDDYGLLRSVQ